MFTRFPRICPLNTENVLFFTVFVSFCSTVSGALLQNHISSQYFNCNQSNHINWFQIWLISLHEINIFTSHSPYQQPGKWRSGPCPWGNRWNLAYPGSHRRPSAARSALQWTSCSRSSGRRRESGRGLWRTVRRWWMRQAIDIPTRWYFCGTFWLAANTLVSSLRNFRTYIFQRVLFGRSHTCTSFR